jgi:CubicO group peptidase (beta-lactamase class C family)
MMRTEKDRARIVSEGLLPIIRVAGKDTRYTLAERQAHYRVPGVGVAIIERGELAWAGGFGRRERDRPAPVDADTVFMGASISKPVTAMLVLQHVQRRVLDLDVDVNRYLKRWQLPENEFTRRYRVTLRACLSHTAGLTVNGWGVRPQGQPVADLIDVLEGRSVSGMPPVVVDKTPGGGERYSGGGYALAQMALEDQTGRSFDSLAQELIFGPLGMTRSSFEHPLATRLRDNVAGGHTAAGEPIPGGWMVSADGGAGGLVTTAPDYARFMIGCRNAFLGRPGAILERGLAQQMMTRQGASTFGLGWRVLGDGATRRFNHGGSNDGYQCETNCYLESGDGGVVMTNAVGGIFLFAEVHNALADAYAWPGFMPAPKRIVPLSEADQQRLVGDYRITSGIELPLLRIFVENGELKSEIPGLRAGVQTTYMDENGVMFSYSGPYETRICYGRDGRAQEITAYEGGATPVIRAVRKN